MCKEEIRVGKTRIIGPCKKGVEELRELSCNSSTNKVALESSYKREQKVTDERPKAMETLADFDEELTAEEEQQMLDNCNYYDGVVFGDSEVDDIELTAEEEQQVLDDCNYYDGVVFEDSEIDDIELTAEEEQQMLDDCNYYDGVVFEDSEVDDIELTAEEQQMLNSCECYDGIKYEADTSFKGLDKCQNILRLMEPVQNKELANTGGIGKKYEIVDKSAYEYATIVLAQESFTFLDKTDSSACIAWYNGRYWEKMTDIELQDFVYKYISTVDKQNNNNIDPLRKNIVKYIKYETRERCILGEGFTESDFQKINNRIVFRNCVYDVQKKCIYPHDKSLPYYFGINADYIEEDESTKNFDKIKRDAMGTDEMSMDMLDYMIGYCMIPNQTGKCYFVMADARDSGKSLIGQFIADMYVGNPVANINLEKLADQFSLGKADEIVLLTCLEMNTDRLKKSVVTQIKRITGDKTICAEEKYQSQQTVRNRIKIVLASNSGVLLPVGMEDSAFYRRTIVIPFIKSTPLDKLKADMDRRLLKERDAILSKCARKLKNIISEDGGIVFPESQMSLKMKEKWIGGVSFDDEFISKAFEYTGDSEDRVSARDIDLVYHWFLNTIKADSSMTIKTERKNLIHKIMNEFNGSEYKKSKVKRIGEVKKQTENAIRRLKWKDEFLQEIGFYHRTEVGAE